MAQVDLGQALKTWTSNCWLKALSKIIVDFSMSVLLFLLEILSTAKSIYPTARCIRRHISRLNIIQLPLFDMALDYLRTCRLLIRFICAPIRALTRRKHFPQLPTEILDMIYSYLPLEYAAALTLTCLRFYHSATGIRKRRIWRSERKTHIRFLYCLERYGFIKVSESIHHNLR